MGALVVVILVAVVLAGPLALIWAVNTLFALGVAYTFKTWLAALLLAAPFSGARAKRD